MQGNRRSSLVDCPVFRFSARADPRFVSPLAAGVAMSDGVGIVRTGAAARCGRRRLDCAGAGWHPLGASASAADVGRGSRSDGPSPRPGRGPAVGHALDRAARHRRQARPHRSPAGPDGATGPVHRGLPVSTQRPRGEPRPAGSTSRTPTPPAGGMPGRTRGRARYSALGPAAGPAAGQDPAGATETRASGARTPRSRQPEPRPGRLITALIPKCDVFRQDMPWNRNHSDPMGRTVITD